MKRVARDEFLHPKTARAAGQGENKVDQALRAQGSSLSLSRELFEGIFPAEFLH